MPQDTYSHIRYIYILYIYMYIYITLSSHLEIRCFRWELRLQAVDGLTSQKVPENP